MSNEMTLAKEIALEFEWYTAHEFVGYFTNEEKNKRAIGKTRLAVFGQHQTGLDRF